MRTKVELSQPAWAVVALRGPDAQPPATGAGVEAVADASWPGLVGYDLLGPGPTAPPDVVALDPADLEIARIESGIVRMGSELTERTIPAETGLIDRTVSFTKGCYTGQELVARIDSRGSKVARRLCGPAPVRSGLRRRRRPEPSCAPRARTWATSPVSPSPLGWAPSPWRTSAGPSTWGPRSRWCAEADAGARPA